MDPGSEWRKGSEDRSHTARSQEPTAANIYEELSQTRENSISPHGRPPHKIEEGGHEAGGSRPDLLGLSDDEEVEQGRVPRSRHQPQGMTPEELKEHSLAHIPYHTGCICCVGARKRDRSHYRKENGVKRT